MALVGYVRVSTSDQETQRQHDALDGICVRVFSEKISGGTKAADRPGLQAAIDYLRDGDLLTVQEVDRLGRNLLEGLLVLNELFERGVSVKVLDGVATGEHTERNLILDLALALAEDRRRDISRKTRNGLEAAAKRGTKGGRPTVVTGDRRRAILGRRADGESLRKIARGVGVSTAVVHGVLHEHDREEAASPRISENEHADAREELTPHGDEQGTRDVRAIRPRERIDPDTVRLDRNQATGGYRALGISNDRETVLVGFLDRQGRKWRAHGPHMSSIPGHWRTRQEALLRLVEPHAG